MSYSDMTVDSCLKMWVDECYLHVDHDIELSYSDFWDDVINGVLVDFCVEFREDENDEGDVLFFLQSFLIKKQAIQFV